MTQTLILTPRLQAVADLVPVGSSLADIGTDHAYLPAWLLKENRISRAIAADLREGPLKRARETASFYGLNEQMDFRLSDGLAGISPEEADTIVIAGMGGETIAAILSAAPWTKDGAHRLILQPMSSQEDLRRWLSGNGYLLEEEHLAREGNSLYNIILSKGGTAHKLSDMECLTGCFPISEPELGNYLEGHLRRLERRIMGLSKSSRESAWKESEKLKLLYSEMEGIKREWENANRK